MNGLPRNVKRSLREFQKISHNIEEDDIRVIISHHNGSGYKGRLITEGQITNLTLRKIIDGGEDYFIIRSKSWNVVLRTKESIILYEPNEKSEDKIVELSQKIANSYSKPLVMLSNRECKEEWRRVYHCLDFLEKGLASIVPRF